MAFKKHDWVRVTSLKQEGEILRLLKSGLVEVAVGDVVVQCDPSDIALVPKGKERRREARDAARKLKRASKESLGQVVQSVDLHGMRVLEALDLVGKRLDQAILADCDALKVVHGVGSGAIMSAVHAYLRGLSAVKRFQLDPKNPGVTWVYF